MAKESVKARQKKREKMVAQYAEKRKALKEAGDYRGLGSTSKKCFSGSFKKPLPAYRPPTWLFKALWTFKKYFPRYGFTGKNSGSKKSKLVKN